MKRIILLSVLLGITHLLVFGIGSAFGERTALKDFTTQTEKADAQVSLGHYTVYRDIAVSIKNNRYERAKCSAQLTASAFLDDVKRCVANSACRGSIETEAHKLAPEVLGQAPLSFDYIGSKGGVRTCD